ncbi:hypothetical protein DAETH_29090 [Deinococcus aetherius]|uniref:Peptidase C51 domain-containing protein n=1 Tax=Deinococcus aetherius TaxID=200252 RepID=A0ABN6RHV7_9DEIO|nr:CHAP domain-containing protein [Deinococcus aetherius]BDP42940.1 hypothetical protein DAETH_29090 [Deinococcus aetherius]
MNLINEAARAAVRRDYDLPTEPGMCLAATRTVVERAFGWPSHELYRRIVTEHVQANTTGTPWATDAEKSFRARGLTVPLWQSPRPGDLVFNHTSMPYGHVGVVVAHAGGLYVLENAQVRRGLHQYAAINLCPLHLWDGITTIGRLPDAEVDDPPQPERRVLLERGPAVENITGKRLEIMEARGVTINAEQPDTVRIAVNVGALPPAKPLKN